MKKRFILTSLIITTSILIGLVFGIFIGIKRGVPFVTEREQWTIGIYRGDSPFNFPASKNKRGPVLKSEDIKDVNARFVADPFLIENASIWYLFFEVYNNDTQQGDLAVATSTNTNNWQYEQVILDEPFHLSYPYIFEWEGVYYIIPETFEAESIRLYKATNFPYSWEFVETLVSGKEFIDPSIAYFNNKWWLFSAVTGNDTLYLYYANDLLGPWQEHPESPIVDGDANIARPGGRILVNNNELYRFTQDADPTYGNQIWAFQITEISPNTYQEVLVSENPILKASGSGWNAQAMHQLDPHEIEPGSWIAAVDGFGKYFVFGFQY